MIVAVSEGEADIYEIYEQAQQGDQKAEAIVRSR